MSWPVSSNESDPPDWAKRYSPDLNLESQERLSSRGWGSLLLSKVIFGHGLLQFITEVHCTRRLKGPVSIEPSFYPLRKGWREVWTKM